jgi:hypothetical protein
MSKSRKSKPTPDPVFKLIQKHMRAEVEFYRALKVVPGTLSPDPKLEDKYGNREARARSKLIGTAPTTLAGMFALLDYIRGVSDGDQAPNGKPDETFEVPDLIDVIRNSVSLLRQQFSGAT